MFGLPYVGQTPCDDRLELRTATYILSLIKVNYFYTIVRIAFTGFTVFNTNWKLNLDKL